ncbi:MAG TPA: Uma2 family endonuclease [Kofleriaceae bacterium]|nr:Uma2 family endonuclease [Kofleriaceae bacterium]
MQNHVLDPPAIAPDRILPLRIEEYMRLSEVGVFDDEKVELLDGVVVKMSAQGPKHMELVAFMNRLLARRLPDDYAVLPQCTHLLSEHSAPEPDFVVVTARSVHAHERETATWLVEVAESSIRKDLGLKARLYAAAGVAEYWVIDANVDAVVVHLEPSADGYRSITTHGRFERLAPRAFPSLVFSLDELLAAR